MMSALCAPDLSYANEEEMFLVAEAVCGQLQKPAIAGTDRAYSVGPVDFAQEQEFLDDEQIRATASRLTSIVGRKVPGDFSFDTYVKPSGTPGTVPEHHVLFEALMGAEAIVPATSVTYSLTNQLAPFSLWVLKGHTAFAFRGSTVESADFSIAGDAIAGISWTGKYMEQLWAGTCTAAVGECGIGDQIIQLLPRAAQLYSVGMYVNVGTDTNGGNGYQITAIDYDGFNNGANNKITLHKGVVTDQSANREITPWWPTAGAEVGEPVHGKLGIVTVGGANAIVLNATVSMVNNIKYYIGEKNNLLTAARFGRPKIREIDGNLNCYFVRRGPSYFYRAEWQVSDALVIPAGNVAGSIMTLNVPYAEYRTPTISGDEEFIQDIPFQAIASAAVGNDEFSIVFT